VPFDANVLLNFIVDEAKDDIKIRSGNSVYKTRKGYIAHIINLFLKLRELAEKNCNIKSLTESTYPFIKINSLAMFSRALLRRRCSKPKRILQAIL